MTGELKSAIERLYQTFAIYPCKPTMEGCPCCISGADKEKIHSKPSSSGFLRFKESY